MSEWKVSKTAVNGIMIALTLLLLTFGSLKFYQVIKGRSAKIYLAVSKYKGASMLKQYPRVLFCFDVFEDQIQMHSNCQGITTESIICGLQNESKGAWDSKFMLQDPDKLAVKVESFLRDKGCKEVVVDFEGIKHSKEFSQAWTSKFAKRLRLNMEVYYAAYAKTERRSNNPAADIQDYQFICDNFSEIWLMAYDFHIPPYTKQGPIAPLSWVKKVVKHALRTCSKEQIRLGLAAYGYDWNTSKHISEIDYEKEPKDTITVEGYKQRREKINHFLSRGIEKYFVWADSMFERVM